MSIRQQALRGHNAIHGFRRENTHAGLVSMAHLVRIAAPKLPPVAEYDAWLVGQLSDDPRARSKWTGAKLRRAIVMKQSGETVGAIGSAVGCCSQQVGKWLHRLPQSLGGTAPPHNPTPALGEAR